MKKVILVITLQAFVIIGFGQQSGVMTKNQYDSFQRITSIKQIHYKDTNAVYYSQSAYKGLIADETKITDLKASVKIETQNETIYNKLVKEMASSLKYVTIRHDKEMWILYFKRESRAEVMAWFKKLNGD